MRVLKFLGLTVLGLLSLAFLVVQLFGGPIARRVVTALNQEIQTPLTIATYDLSLWRAFPHLSVDLQDVHVAGSDGSDLLTARHIACVLDLGSLFGDVRVSGIRIEEGRLQLLTDRDGNTNYQIIHTSVGDHTLDKGGTAGEKLFLEAARLRDVLVVYRDEQLQTDARFTVREAALSGQFGSSDYVLSTQASLAIDYVEQEDVRYLDRKDLTLGGQLSIDNATGTYALTPLTLYASRLEVAATGTLTPTAGGLSANLRLSSNAGNLEDIFALLPPAYARPLAELETRGAFQLETDISGAWTTTTYPRINGTLTLHDGRLGSPRMNVGAHDLELRATFAYLDGPRGGVQTLAVEELTGNFRGRPFDLQLRLEDLHDPFVTFSADGSLPLSALPAFLEAGTVEEADGLLHFDGLTLSGRYADMLEARRMGRVKSSGTLRAEGIDLEYYGRPLRLSEGELVLADNELNVSDLVLQLDHTDVVLNGSGSNLIPVLFADSLNTRDAALRFDAKLSGDFLDLAEVLALSAPTDEPSVTTGPSADRLIRRGIEQRARLTDLLHGTLTAEVAGWSYEGLHGEDFRGQLLFLPGRLDVRGVTEAMEGQFRVDAITYFDGLTKMDIRLTAEDVAADEFFRQFADFDQEVLTADHLSGRMNARLLIDLPYDSLEEIDYSRLHVLGDLEVLDGELHDFGMLENFAFALKAGDLERVRFTRLANVFEIDERTIHIPAMFIQSSAINLTLSGRHTFDQQLDYAVKVNAGQVLANKLSRHDRALEVLPARNGLFNMYYTIEGPLETYAVRTDKRSVKTDFQRSAYRRDRIRRTLAERFRTPIELFDLEDDDAVSR